jgi:hypothetical protein
MLVSLILSGCMDAPDDTTSLDAMSVNKAVGEVIDSGAEETLTRPVVEITADVTIGDRAEAAAEERRAFLASQIPCADISRSGDTVTIDFGTLQDGCTWEGQNYGGMVRFTIHTSDHAAAVDEEWVGFTNGDIVLNGWTWTQWDDAMGPRDITHDVTWTGSDGVEHHSSGERFRSLIDASEPGSGVRLDGDRDWTVDDGSGAPLDWYMVMSGIEMRGVDPVPQAGTETVIRPDGARMTMTYTRMDEDTIRVTIVGESYVRTFDITSAGSDDGGGGGPDLGTVGGGDGSG